MEGNPTRLRDQFTTSTQRNQEVAVTTSESNGQRASLLRQCRHSGNLPKRSPDWSASFASSIPLLNLYMLLLGEGFRNMGQHTCLARQWLQTTWYTAGTERAIRLPASLTLSICFHSRWRAGYGHCSSQFHLPLLLLPGLEHHRDRESKGCLHLASNDVCPEWQKDAYRIKD